jgi:hypothetical protein
MNKDFDFSPQLLGLDGKQLTPPMRIADALAPALAGNNQGDALKFYMWAVAMYQNGVISIDLSDSQTLRTFVANTLSLNNLVKAQALAVIDAVKY